ncbi:hypothetical protein Leryth_013983 [Lithospermum erythrorhizon]|nr:hypothetical protein Leryth_013983 [Lithospermum erythrorhizon]
MESSESTSEKVFPNGDVYVGNFKGVVSNGKGRYSWMDGTTYDGEWEEGKMTGKGKMFFTSGATYDGDFSGGYLHGIGIYTSSDGSVYRGGWKMNSQHGIGRKQYQNSDVYDGCWKEGVREGSGRYKWGNDNMYIGNWKHGQMCGRGVMKFSNGDLFDGSWLDGFRHGTGCYRFSDGSYYFGNWTKGLKDGLGTFYPAGHGNLSSRRYSSVKLEDKRKELQSHSSLVSSEESMKPIGIRILSKKISKRFLRSSGSKPQRSSLLDQFILDDSTMEVISSDASCAPYQFYDEAPAELDNSTVACEREYMQGVLIKERIREIAKLKNKLRKFRGSEMKKNSFLAIFYGHKSYFLRLNLQLGIRYTVGKITPVPMREVRPSDFEQRARMRMYFPRNGSQFTPPHRSTDFYWKDYCPMVFRNLREMFKLNPADYMMSICGDDGLRELSSSGKSGSLFYVSRDDRFVIKTLKQSEVKFFGLHQIALMHGKKVRFVVMGNMFCTELRIHRRYDLKGSTLGRFTNKDKIDEGTTLKDLDLTFAFHMDKLLRQSLFKQISLDCDFLKNQGIIDYSLLLGLHFRAPEHLKALLEPPDSVHKRENPVAADGLIYEGECSIPPRGLLLVTHEPSSVDTAPGTHIRGNTLKAYSVGEKEVDLLLPGTEGYVSR